MDSIEGAPAEGANRYESLTGAGGQPHRLHQAEVEEAQGEAARHVGQVLLPQQYPGHAHQEGPEHQQDAEWHSQHQVGQQELGDHGRPAGVRGGEGVHVHGHVVQEARRHLPGAFALHQLLDTSHGHDVKDEGCQREREKRG